MGPNLPSLKCLVAFEATARNLSFSRAGVELNLTQTAISHQIKALEDLLGARLFVRQGNTIRLTDIGREYLGPARAAITEVFSATDRAINHGRGDVLTIASPGTYLTKCLLPRLPDFRKRFPKIFLRIQTIVPFEIPLLQDFDISIQYGTGDWPGMTAHKIADEEVFPICSPRLLKERHGLKRPADLRHHTMIRTRSPFIPRDDWPFWLESAGIPDVEFADTILCDLLYPSFQAAIEGLGVAMGRSGVVERDIAAGRLVEPFSIRIPSISGYYLVAPPKRFELEKVQQFLGWFHSKS
jgi:LysR family glycine cleavage system transcriptional activator